MIFKFVTGWVIALYTVLTLVAPLALAKTAEGSESYTLVIAPATFVSVRSSEHSWPQLQKSLYMQLERSLVRHPKLNLLNRRQLDTALAELKIAASELTDPEQAKKIGRLLIADWLLLIEVESYQVSRIKRSFVFESSRIEAKELELTVNFRVLEVATQKLLLSERYNHVFTYKPNLNDNKAVNGNKLEPSGSSLSDTAIQELTEYIIQSINFDLFNEAKPEPVTPLKVGVKEEQAPAAIRALDDADW